MKAEDLKLWDTLEVVTAMPGIPGGMVGVVASVSQATETVTCVATFDIPFECIEHDKVRYVTKSPIFMGADLLMHNQAQLISGSGMIQGATEPVAPLLPVEGDNPDNRRLTLEEINLPGIGVVKSVRDNAVEAISDIGFIKGKVLEGKVPGAPIPVGIWKETLEGDLVEEESRPSWQGSVLPKGKDGK